MNRSKGSTCRVQGLRARLIRARRECAGGGTDQRQTQLLRPLPSLRPRSSPADASCGARSEQAAEQKRRKGREGRAGSRAAQRASGSKEQEDAADLLSMSSHVFAGSVLLFDSPPSKAPTGGSGQSAKFPAES
eukprot:3565685-Rhodomonas_salina.4